LFKKVSQKFRKEAGENYSVSLDISGLRKAQAAAAAATATAAAAATVAGVAVALQRF
jgi:hypothetical protein